MEFKAFLEQLLDAVNAELPAGRTARYRTVNKPNGVVYTGMYLEAGEKGSVSPIVYMEPIYEGVAGPEVMAHLAKDLSRLLMSPVKQEISAFSVSDFAYAKERIVFRLVSLAGNESLLQNLPHRVFLDLAVIYGVFVSDGNDGDGIGTAQVTFDLMNRWGITENELYERAMENSPRIMGDVIRSLPEFMGDSLPDDTDEDRRKAKEAGRFFIVTNRFSFLGATTLLYSKQFAEISKIVGADLFLLPTSIHEVMTIPADGRPAEEIQKLQKSIVAEDPRKEHCLTENIYYYSAADDAIRMA